MEYHSASSLDVVLPMRGLPARFAPWLGVGAAAVIAGGLVAAGTATAPTHNGAWAAAYLVLVAGVAHLGLTVGLATFTPPGRTTRSPHALMTAWTLGNAAVIVGTLVDVTALVDVGGVVLAVALAVAAYETRGARRSLMLWAYRAVLTILFVSIPAGLILARLS